MRFLNGLAVALGAAILLPATALADDGKPAEQLLACAATRGDVAAVDVERVRWGLAGGGVWAKARLKVVMRNGAAREYSIDGHASPMATHLDPNDAPARFAYSEFACVVNYGAIVAVHNCRSSGDDRTCDVGVTMFGLPVAFVVTMRAAKEDVIEARMP
jgi:hypothetical protein